jgi:hypothetical protein
VWLLKIGLCPKNKSHPLGGWIFTVEIVKKAFALCFYIYQTIYQYCLRNVL